MIPTLYHLSSALVKSASKGRPIRGGFADVWVGNLSDNLVAIKTVYASDGMLKVHKVSDLH